MNRTQRQSIRKLIQNAMDKKYWHEITDEEVTALTAENKTWKDVQDNYLQPDWCNYPNALAGQMGCWSLTIRETRKSICKELCKTCDCYNEQATT